MSPTIYTLDILLDIGRSAKPVLPFSHDPTRLGPILSSAEPCIEPSAHTSLILTSESRQTYPSDVKRSLLAPEPDVKPISAPAPAVVIEVQDIKPSQMDWGSLDVKPPVLLEFKDPFALDSQAPAGRRMSVGDQDGNWRRRRTDSVSSVSSVDLARPSLSGSRPSLLRKGNSTSLNPFAPPFPLPAGAIYAEAKDPALPTLPMPMPASLPKRPGALPPVFVRKESATLPQPMALPAVAPLSHAWDGVVSGNERRRRASSVSSESSLPSRPSSRNDARPERLRSLGNSLRASAVHRIM